MGKLIVLEGTDGCGKATQTEQLVNRLKSDFPDKSIYTFDFPDYKSPACEPVKMYLSGKFGNDARDVNPYAASMLYTIDRFSSYTTTWKSLYKEEKSIIVLDRYTTSNIIYQGAKIPIDSRYEFNSWIYDLEFNKVGLPHPDLVYFLSMPSTKLLHERSKVQKADIHESSDEYQHECYLSGMLAAKQFHWVVVDCMKSGKIRTVEEIHEEIYQHLKNNL